jgi:hypothetical protein
MYPKAKGVLVLPRLKPIKDDDMMMIYDMMMI